MKPTLHLICGLPGAGKSTLARQLEHDLPALRLTADEWMARIVGSGHSDEDRSIVEAIQSDIALRALRLGVDVILENGFWVRAERDQYRARAEAVGAATQLHFLDVPRDELWRRLSARNAALPPDTFDISAEQLEEWWGLFEVPTADELT
ncbi:MAG: AAA family ATPase [Chloroflexi bacterium]|nr:AAA family ATPase [Chloroflexota bacterium]MDA1240471.1 AAA family ATPase [Chloroflexota bacterium]